MKRKRIFSLAWRFFQRSSICFWDPFDWRALLEISQLLTTWCSKIIVVENDSCKELGTKSAWHCPSSVDILPRLEGAFVKRENSRPITSWHVTLPSPQNTANYKAPHIAARFCYHYLETNRNLPSVMQKPNHTSAYVSDDTSSLARVSDEICNLAHVSDDIYNAARVSDDISELIRLWNVSPIKLCHVSLTYPQTPINRSLLKAFQRRAGGVPEKGFERDQDSEVQKLCWNQASKPPRASRTSTLNTKNIRREII